MEIVIAVLLLFGGFTLGSITANEKADASQSTQSLPNTERVPDSHQSTQVMSLDDPTRCSSDRTIIYRDLTLPYHDPIDPPPDQADDCEGGCPND